MKGLCAECGQDLTQLQSKNGRPQVPLSTATVSMVHSVPELMVSSEQAEQLGREDQQRLHRNRKLVLMVDLDQTLIHTTEQLCQQMSNKGIFHFQLGRGEPMLHTRLRPHCKGFLEKIAKLYELHVFTFGSRLYAHTIAGFLDPEKKLFSHRILSRDECIDPFSKTGNLRNLFPCGDSMVCIIDDREDVWKFAPNLITVKKYVYFQGIGDINAPSGSREPQARRRVSASPKGADATEQPPSVKDPEEGRQVSGVEQSNGLGKPTRELNGGAGPRGGWPCPGQEEERGARPAARTPSADGRGPLAGTQQHGRTPPEKRPVRGPVGPDPDPDVPGDSGSSSESEGRPSPIPSDGESGEKRTRRKPPAPPRHAGDVAAQGGPPGASPCVEPGPGVQAAVQGEGERDGLCGLGGGCADRREAETESQNSEQSGITVGESLDQSAEEEEEEEEDADADDHLVHLEEILARVHSAYYARYDRFLRGETQEAPDIRKIVPELRSRVLADVAIIFSGLHPTNFPIEKTREHYHATALGARILTQLVLDPDNPDRATHLIAARAGPLLFPPPQALTTDQWPTAAPSRVRVPAGTEKVRQAQDCGQLHVVNPDWLWSCLERWDKVEERLFPLRGDQAKSQREDGPAAFPDRQGLLPTTLFHPTPVHPKAPPGPEVRIYDASTGKLIRKGAAGPGPPGSLPVHAELSSFRAVQPHHQQTFGEDLPANQDGEQPGPSGRKRQPSMSETMPLYTLCKEDLESMDKEGPQEEAERRGRGQRVQRSVQLRGRGGGQLGGGRDGGRAGGRARRPHVTAGRALDSPPSRGLPSGGCLSSRGTCLFAELHLQKHIVLQK
ncbi:RNA polymerase II subunit A C-terminal domain phosphatase isoform X4 [Balaenoptera ricei]|uniref:RNA polymerase II subunit A C-terminal domain phosphatase isoform X4 n=1 Tax=Balaenoptera ricei TaxID=2746895 RepID=UPI0028BE5BDC|nr:RNA polymerase II subunit A C-terminal domain phosphatase isoform X4 [Balaenoptera ricei]